jgi:hypothetical protein
MASSSELATSGYELGSDVSSTIIVLPGGNTGLLASDTAGASNASLHNRAEAERLAAVNCQIISDLRQCFISTLSKKESVLDVATGQDSDTSCIGSEAGRKARSEILTALEKSQTSSTTFAFHDHCLPVLYENNVAHPDVHVLRNGNETEHIFKYSGPQEPLLFMEAGQMYHGAPLSSHPQPFNGYGLWLSVRSQETETPFSLKSIAKSNGQQHLVAGAVTATILFGHLSGSENQLLKGSLMHVHVPYESLEDFNSASYQRCVGFSYNGTLSLKKPQNTAMNVEENFIELQFDSPNQENAVFREFEFAIAVNKDETLTCQHNSDELMYSRRISLPLLVGMFIDSLSDDGKERKDFRKFQVHKEFANFNNENFVNFLKTNYISAGLQYFVPKIIAKSMLTFARCSSPCFQSCSLKKVTDVSRRFYICSFLFQPRP